MPTRFSLAVSSFLILAISTTLSQAQARTDIFVTPVPNAPFTAVINVERSLVLRDGSTSHLKTIREIGRDSRGRIYNEGRALLSAVDTSTPQVIRVHLYDPQTRVTTMLNAQTRTYWTGTVDRPPETVPPTLLSSPAGNSLPQNEFTKEEDLGSRQMEGLPVRGIRETQTIPAESSGTGKDVVVSDEFWYSDDLRINLLIRHSDPRTGSVTMTVTHVARTEPDPAHFEIPAGYTRAGSTPPAKQ
jgi:hypothetical protein